MPGTLGRNPIAPNAVCKVAMRRNRDCALRAVKLFEGRYTSGFAYLRTRRIPAETIFRGIQHEQVWTALQLIHDVDLSRYEATLCIQIARGKSGLVSYMPKVSEAAISAMHAAIHDYGQAIVYSWQPALLV